MILFMIVYVFIGSIVGLLWSYMNPNEPKTVAALNGALWVIRLYLFITLLIIHAFFFLLEIVINTLARLLGGK